MSMQRKGIDKKGGKNIMNVPWAMILNKLESLGIKTTEGIKEVIEYMWPLAVKQVILNIVCWLVFDTIVFGVVIFLWKKHKYAENDLKKEKTESYYRSKYCEEEIKIYKYISAGLAMFAILVFVIIVTTLFNYEWYAIQKLINLIIGR